MTPHNKKSPSPSIPLAFFGARPAFATPLPLHRPHYGNRDMILEGMAGILDSRDAGDRPLVADFEERIAIAAGVRHCVGVCTAGAALELAIRGLNFKGEVILPSFMPAAAAHALQRQGITPVFCDIDPRTRTLDARHVKSLVTPRTTGIIGAHLWGEPCRVDELQALSRERRLRLLFDASHAFGCSHRGKPIGGFGDAEVFRFDAGSPLYAFDGAAVTTNDTALARRLRILQNLGFDEDGASVCLGIEGKMNEACAALGLASLERIHAFIEENRRVLARYDLQLTDLAGVVLMAGESMDQRNYQHAVVEVDQGAAGISRDALLAVLRAENVLARRDFSPGSHRLEPYRLANAEAWLRLQVTERLAERVLCLPAGAGLSEAVVDRICDILRLAVQHRSAIMARLQPPARRS